MYLLTRSKFIGKQEKIVLIKNKHQTPGPAARVPCGRRRAVSAWHSRPAPHTGVDRDHATRPSSMMGTTSADYPPAARSGRAREGPAVEHPPPARQPEALAGAEAWETQGVGASSLATMCFQVTSWGREGYLGECHRPGQLPRVGRPARAWLCQRFPNAGRGLRCPAAGAPSGCRGGSDIAQQLAGGAGRPAAREVSSQAGAGTSMGRLTS